MKDTAGLLRSSTKPWISGRMAPPTMAITSPAAPNFGVFDNWIQEPAFLSGMIAGKMTKTGVVGAVAAMAIPEVNRLVNAFFAGAKEVNPDVKKKVAFIGSFFDPPKAKEAAIAQIEAQAAQGGQP